MNKYQEGWNGFLELCFATKDIKHFSTMLDLLLTTEEKENLAMRYLIIKALLQKKKTQREIAKQLNVSIAKITRGSNELKRISPTLLRYLESLFQ